MIDSERQQRRRRDTAQALKIISNLNLVDRHSFKRRELKKLLCARIIPNERFIKDETFSSACDKVTVFFLCCLSIFRTLSSLISVDLIY